MNTREISMTQNQYALLVFALRFCRTGSTEEIQDACEILLGALGEDLTLRIQRPTVLKNLRAVLVKSTGRLGS